MYAIRSYYAPSVRTSRTTRIAHALPDLAAFAALMAALAYALFASAASLGYHWQWYAVPRYLLTWGADGPEPGLLLSGLGLTLRLSAAALPVITSYSIHYTKLYDDDALPDALHLLRRAHLLRP